MRAVSIDSGSSYLKAYDGVQKIIFPAMTLDLDGRQSAHAITVGGESYLTGYAVLGYEPPLRIPHLEASFHGSPEQHVQMCAALDRLGAVGDFDYLLISLPFVRAHDKRLLKALLEKKQYVWTDAKGDAKNAQFNQIKITSQGIGTLRFYRRHKEPVHSAILVDVGSCTTDIVVVQQQDQGGWDFVENVCGSLQTISTNTFFKRWARALTNIPGFAERRWNYFSLMERAIKKNFILPGCHTEVSVEACFKHVSRAWTQELYDQVREQVGDMVFYDTEKIILTGGGAQLLHRKTWQDSRAAVTDVYANVVGQHEYYTDPQEGEQ